MRFTIRHNVGRCKYLVSYYDGVATHNDGSEFWGCAIFSNKRKLAIYLRSLRAKGYREV
jgi:hypothetical protein